LAKTLTLTEQEKKQLKADLKTQETDIKVVASRISMLVKAFEGRPIEPDDIITRLTNVKNILERSRFPTYPLLAKQVYLRLIAKYVPEADSCLQWADREAEALISYRGQSRSEYVEMTRAAYAQEEAQRFYIGDQQAPQPQKRGFLSRFRKPKPQEETEFTNK